MSTADGDPGPWRARAVEPAFVSARRRAWAVLGCAMVGCWVGASHPGGMSSRVWFLVALVLAVALLAIGRRYWARFGRFALLFAIVCAMAGWSVRRGCEPAADRADQLLADGAVVTLEGTIVGGPEQIERPDGPGAPGAWRADRARFDLKLSAILEQDGGRVHAGGVVGVRAPIDVLGVVSAGESCTVTGVFRAPGGPSNPGEPDWRRLGNERGMGGSLSVPDTGLIEPRDGARDARGVFIGVRTRLRDRARRALGEDPSGVLGALVLGERDASFDETYRVFQRAGVAHVLAVSGFHLALLGGFVALAIRATGERGRLETVGVLVVVIAMLFMVPARAPILRAGVLVIALLIGDAAGRRNDRLALLAWAGVGLLIWRPSDASGLGFLLSVGVTATLLGLAERQQRERRAMLERAGVSVGGGVPGAAWRWLRGAARVNVSCWAVATPTIVASTGVCSLIAPVATLLVVPMAGLLLVCGWAQAALGVLWPGGAERTAPVVGWLGEAVGRFATWIDGIPWSSVMVSGVGWIWCALTKMCISALLFAPRARRAGVTLLCCCVVYAAVAHARSGRVPGLRADMIDVGDGTAILVRSGGEAVLWDCGGLHRPVGRTVADAARALGVTRVRTGVVTHANIDHFNGFPEIAEELGMETLFVTPALMASRDGAWGAVRGALEASAVVLRPLQTGDVIQLGRGSGLVLWAGTGPDERWLGNDGSLAVRFTVDTSAGERSMLLCGDLQTAGAAGLLSSGLDVRSDVMEAPHHGSVNNAAIELVGRVAPSVVLQSTGPGRVGLEAWAESRERSRWLSTAERGAVFAEIMPNGSIRSGGTLPTPDAN